MSNYSPTPHLPFGGQLRSVLSTRYNQWTYARGVFDAIKRVGIDRPIVWNAFPVYSAVRVVEESRASLQFLHMTDAIWDYPWYGPRYERSLRRCLASAAFALGSSPEIVERLESYGKPTHLLEHGVDADRFRAVAEGDQRPHPALEGRRRPRLGLVGSIDYRLDPDVVVALSRIGSVTLVGPIAKGANSLGSPDLARLESAGCHFEGMADRSVLPSWLAGFDVAVLPYRDTPLVAKSNPLKLLEYLAAGLPVVALDIPAARRYAPLVRTARGPDGFVEAVRAILSEESPGSELRRARADLAVQHSWRRRAEELSQHIIDASE